MPLLKVFSGIWKINLKQAESFCCRHYYTCITAKEWNKTRMSGIQEILAARVLPAFRGTLHSVLWIASSLRSSQRRFLNSPLWRGVLKGRGGFCRVVRFLWIASSSARPSLRGVEVSPEKRVKPVPLKISCIPLILVLFHSFAVIHV